MAYGNAQRLGETINPQLMNVDFSAYERAGATTGNALANIGQQVGGVIKQYGDDEKTIKKSAQMAKSIRDAIPELAGMADNALAELSNPDLSQRDRLAIAEGIQDSLKIGVMGLENKRSNALLEIQQDELDAKIAAAKNKGSVMVYTPAELDEYRKSGYDPKIVGRDQFGNLMVETLQGKGVGAGGVTPFMKDGVFGFAPQNPSSFLPTPRAGGNIQNALLKAQGGSFPDNVATTGLPIDQAAGFTPGVSADGTPGVFPPKQQPIIPVGEVPKGDVYSVEGGQVGVTRLPGSNAEIEYKTKAAELEVKQAELAKQQALTKDVTEKQQIKEKGKKNFSDYIGEMAGAYSNLYKKGGAVAGGEGSLGAYAGGTETGQIIGRITGSEAQVYRDVINSMAPNLINVVRQSSEMGAKGLDSEKELKFYLGAIGDPTKPIEANLKALDVLDKAYGDGKAVSNMLIENPQLLRKVKEYGLKFDNKEEKAAGDTELDSIMEEVRQIREKMGVK